MLSVKSRARDARPSWLSVLGLDAKNAAQNVPAGVFLEDGLRRASRLPRPSACRETPAAHTQMHSCARTAAQHCAVPRAPQWPPRRRRGRSLAATRRRGRTHTSRRRRATSHPTPAQEGDGIYTRTNGAGLASLEAGATVSVVGRLTGDSSIETSDGVQINLVEPSEAAQTMMPASGCVEVVGTVRDTGSVSPLRVAAFGDDFDLKNYDDLIGLAGDKYAALFR